MLGLPGAEVIDPVTEARFALSGPLSPIRSGRRASVDVTARFPRRGEHLLAEPSLEASDPLELARVSARNDGTPQRILVLPRVEPVRWRSGERALRFDGVEGDQASEMMAAVDLDGLRPYRVGTPASRIHWPALARGAGLIERRLRADGDNRPLVVLDSRLAGASEDLLDAAVRAAASLALDLGRAGGCGLLLPGDQRPTAIDPELNRWPVAYRRLALVTPQAGSGNSAARGRARALGPGDLRDADPVGPARRGADVDGIRRGGAGRARCRARAGPPPGRPRSYATDARGLRLPRIRARGRLRARAPDRQGGVMSSASAPIAGRPAPGRSRASTRWRRPTSRHGRGSGWPVSRPCRSTGSSAGRGCW